MAIGRRPRRVGALEDERCLLDEGREQRGAVGGELAVVRGDQTEHELRILGTGRPADGEQAADADRPEALCALHHEQAGQAGDGRQDPMAGRHVQRIEPGRQAAGHRDLERRAAPNRDEAALARGARRREVDQQLERTVGVEGAADRAAAEIDLAPQGLELVRERRRPQALAEGAVDECGEAGEPGAIAGAEVITTERSDRQHAVRHRDRRERASEQAGHAAGGRGRQLERQAGGGAVVVALVDEGAAGAG